ncbi:UDP-glucuronosyl/UDP-glucosyltransferase [Corchorus olitorius]|uniref:UDP-glucuronosyl/UDP-glucosyltransferase n=1 Tax=Corchorus olitorius TaxID=93759 RepID=A0A1R3HRG0_9ROSI|nr:UDP-glucuronosyl/UDP-glucosyltransferase [Corchorus olitorius]
MAEDSSKLHIAMFPWLAFGHMIPYLELAKLIAQKGHTISFISTPRNIDRLPKLPPSLSSSIHLVKLPLPQVENLPENAEATIDVPYEKVPYLKKALDGLEDPMAKFLETSSPDWLLFDFLPYWLPPLAHNLRIPTAMFSIFIAACVAQIKPTDIQDDREKPEDFTRPPKWIPFPTTIAFRLFEITKIFDAITGQGDTHPSDLYRAEKSLQLCDAIVVRSCWELETDFLNLLTELHNKPVIPTGQLPPVVVAYNNEDDDHDEATWKPIKKWLDKQETGTVVYVAFGSEANPNQEEVREIALGLELSGLPFFWVLRSSSTIELPLPDGFEDRTKGRGVVWKTWAPQVKILAHESVGGFLSHGGWSSVVEAITFQRPLILLTFLADQGWNARFLEERKMGYVIPRNDNDGSFSQDSVAESLRLVVLEEAGQVYRENVKKMKGVFGDPELQDRYVDQLLNFLVTNKNILLSPKPIGN